MAPRQETEDSVRKALYVIFGLYVNAIFLLVG